MSGSEVFLKKRMRKKNKLVLIDRIDKDHSQASNECQEDLFPGVGPLPPVLSFCLKGDRFEICPLPHRACSIHAC
jgi:hypothetical protein